MSHRPNVLVIMADDHRFQSLGCHGAPGLRTPHLDALSGEGWSFHRAYTMGGLTGAVCIPSRACLMTGMGTFNAVISQTVDETPGLATMDPEIPTLPELFRHQGYQTFATGKWHNDHQSFNRGFADGAAIFMGGMSDHFAIPLHGYDAQGHYPRDRARPGEGHSTDLIARTAVDFLHRYDGDSPFFLYVAFTAPHDPRTPPPPFASLYDATDEALSLPPNAFPQHPFQMGDLEVRDELLEAFPREAMAVRQHVADYYGMISHMDQRIGDILSALDDRDLRESTLVLYLSDHGLALGQHGLMGKQNLYDHSLHIPCILRAPGLPGARRPDNLVQHMDVLPTLCELADMPVPSHIEGQSMLSGRSGDASDAHQCLLSLYKNYSRAVIASEMKLIRHFEESESGERVCYEQLFDLTSDPHEVHNLAFGPQHTGLLAQLRRNLRELQTAYHDPLLDRVADHPPAHTV